MDKMLKTSLKIIERINYKKYGWVLTTASIVAIIFYQRGKDDNDDNSQKDQKSSDRNVKKEYESLQSELKQGESKSKRIDQKQQDKQNEQKQQLQQSQQYQQQNKYKQVDSIQSLKEQKMQQTQHNLKKQIQELDKRLKKSNSNSSLLRISMKGKASNSRLNEEQTNFQPYQQYGYAMSDIESRQYMQAKQSSHLKKLRKYVTDIDEPTNSQKRNQILKIAKDQNPNDGLFFQVLASLAENEDEYD